MKNKQTTNLLMEGLIKEKNFSRFLESNKEHFINLTVRDYMNYIIHDKNLDPIEIIRKSNIERSYFYQIANGRRVPSRDKMIQLAIGMKLDIDETQKLLKIGNKTSLYPKVKRDAAIIFCIKNNFDLIKTQEFLDELKMISLGE